MADVGGEILSVRESPRRVSRRWLLCFGIGLTALAAMYLLGQYTLRAWMAWKLPDDAPRIAFSTDDTWMNLLGISDSTYQQAFARAGGRLVPLSQAEYTPGGIHALIDDNKIDGILLTGGGDVDPTLYGGDPDSAVQVDRARDDFEIALIKAALRKDIPILGICRGCQILNVANGGALINLCEDATRSEAHFNFSGHAAEITLGSRLAKALQETRLENVYSFHGQAVGRPGESIAVVARGPSGIIEAI